MGAYSRNVTVVTVALSVITLSFLFSFSFSFSIKVKVTVGRAMPLLSLTSYGVFHQVRPVSWGIIRSRIFSIV